MRHRAATCVRPDLPCGCSPSAPFKKIQEAHKRIMVANHPDRGGSPYLAAKVNEAKELLDKVHSGN